jgi:two-component system response regulator
MSTSAAPPPVEVLLVEDNPGDVELAEEGLWETTVPVSLSVVHDGEEALRYFRSQGEYADMPPPDLVLLDLRLPGKGGLEVLAEIRADRQLRGIPVVVLTDSEAAEDVRRARDLGASRYFTKPSDLAEFRRVMRSVRELCRSLARSPTGSQHERPGEGRD